MPIRLLVRNLCLIPQPCLRLRSTATDLFPGSGLSGASSSDQSEEGVRILPPLEASIASAAEFLRYQYPVLCTAPADWRFRLCPGITAWGRADSRKVSLPFSSRFSASRMLEDTLHRAAETVGSKADACAVPVACHERAFRPTAHFYARS